MHQLPTFLERTPRDRQPQPLRRQVALPRRPTSDDHARSRDSQNEQHPKLADQKVVDEQAKPTLIRVSEDDDDIEMDGNEQESWHSTIDDAITGDTIDSSKELNFAGKTDTLSTYNTLANADTLRGKHFDGGSAHYPLTDSQHIAVSKIKKDMDGLVAEIDKLRANQHDADVAAEKSEARIKELMEDNAVISAKLQSGVRDYHKKRERTKQDLDESEISGHWRSLAYNIKSWASRYFSPSELRRIAKSRLPSAWLQDDVQHNSAFRATPVDTADYASLNHVQTLKEAHLWYHIYSWIFTGPYDAPKGMFAGTQVGPQFTALCEFLRQTQRVQPAEDQSEAGSPIEYTQDYHSWRSNTAHVIQSDSEHARRVHHMSRILVLDFKSKIPSCASDYPNQTWIDLESIMKAAIELDAMFQRQRAEYYVDAFVLRPFSAATRTLKTLNLEYRTDAMESWDTEITIQPNAALRVVMSPRLLKIKNGQQVTLIPAKVITDIQKPSRLQKAEQQQSSGQSLGGNSLVPVKKQPWGFLRRKPPGSDSGLIY